MTEARLVTIGVSHFCEKARWGLAHAAIPYREEPHLPLFHIPAARRAGGRRTTPVLVLDGRTLADSTDILVALDERLPPERRLFPDGPVGDEVRALEDRFDRELGPHVRRMLYFHLLPLRGLAIEVVSAGVPPLERRLLPALFPVLRALMRRGMRIDAAGAERSKEKVLGVFRAMDERLADGRSYLAGDRFTAADLTLAALSAPMIGCSGYGVRLPTDAEIPPALLAELLPFRESRTAEHVRRMYARHRNPGPTPR